MSNPECQHNQTAYRCAKIDFIGRLGFEEQSFRMFGTNSEANAIAEKLRIAIEKTPISGAEETIHVTVSIGIATAIPVSEDNAEQLLKGADHVMYHAKNSGRNRITARFKGRRDSA